MKAFNDTFALISHQLKKNWKIFSFAKKRKKNYQKQMLHHSERALRSCFLPILPMEQDFRYFIFFRIPTFQSFTYFQYQYFHSKHRVNDNSLIMSHGINRGKLPSVIWDHFEEDVRKVQRLLIRFISIKTFEAYVHIIKRCRFIFYSSIAFI